jgi:hypothetical protein
MKSHLKIILLIIIGVANSFAQKPRTVITTDGEIDDEDSFIRMLLYANEFKIEGLVYSSSMWHYKGDGQGTKFVSEMEMTKKLYGEKTNLRWPGVTWMQELIDAYQKIYPNLKLHAEGYPTAEELKKRIKIGNIDFEGEMEKETEGSNFIKNLLLDNNPEPIYLQVWGGTNTIARALKSIEEQYQNSDKWKEIYEKICKKAIIYTILDQDATYKKYISENWKDLKIFYNSNQFWCFAYPWKKAVPEQLHYLLEGNFMGENIINNHGPLLKMYYSYGDGQKQEGDEEHIHGDLSKIANGQWGGFGKYDFISEGDSPAYFHLIDVGLDNLNHPEYGGWGGRLVQSKENPNRWEDGENTADFNPYTKTMDKTYAQTRWVEALQNDFAARADWCILDYKNANHAPVVSLKMSKNIKSKPNKFIKIKGNAKDPDGDSLNFKWWQYHEVDTYNGFVEIKNANQKNAKVLIPKDAKKGQNIHLIFEVSDQHKNQMTRYKRVIITII